MLKHGIGGKMTYSESELDSNFAINSVSDFDSESDSSLAVKNLDICIFFTLYLYYYCKPVIADFYTLI